MTPPKVDFAIAMSAVNGAVRDFHADRISFFFLYLNFAIFDFDYKNNKKEKLF